MVPIVPLLAIIAGVAILVQPRFLGSGYIVNDKLKLYVIINHLVIR